MNYVYEFIGTFFLIFTIGMSVIEPNSAGTLAPLAIGSVLAVMVFAGGHISGAHYNPAVSFALFLKGGFPKRDFGFYCLAQLIAAGVAGCITLYLKGYPSLEVTAMDPIKALLAEFLFTFALCFVILNVAAAKETRGNSYFGFAIGFVVLAGIYVVGPVSSAAFNPAVAFGIAWMSLVAWTDLWIYIVANFAAAAAAVYVFKKAHSHQ